MTVVLQEDQVVLFPTYKDDQLSWKCTLPDPLTGNAIYASVGDKIGLVTNSEGAYTLYLPQITVWAGYYGADCAYMQYRNNFINSIKDNVKYAMQEFLEEREFIADKLKRFDPPDNWLSPLERADRDRLSHSAEHAIYPTPTDPQQDLTPERRMFAWVVTKSGKQYIEELGEGTRLIAAQTMSGTAHIEMQSYPGVCRSFDHTPTDILERNAKEIAEHWQNDNILSVTEMFTDKPHGIVVGE